MIEIAEKNTILIVTEEKVDNLVKKYENIDILKIKIDKQSIKKINDDSKEKYNYIFFIKECVFGNELINYLPIYFVDNCCNKLFINELVVNPIIIESIELLLNSISVIEIGILIKHILRNNIKKENFDFSTEVEKLKKINNCTDYNIKHFKEKIYKAVGEKYSQDNIAEIENFNSNREKIVKQVIYEILYDVIYKLKNTNELVFKKFIRIII